MLARRINPHSNRPTGEILHTLETDFSRVFHPNGLEGCDGVLGDIYRATQRLNSSSRSYTE